MANIIPRFIISSLIVACLILPTSTHATADDGEADIGVSVNVTEDDQGNGGGGGGSGGNGGSRGITAFAEIMTPTGRLMKDVVAPSSDLKAFIVIQSGTYCRDSGGGTINWIAFQALSSTEYVPAPPEGFIPILPHYRMLPEGTTFDPPITCTFKYIDLELPEGADKNNLVITWWDPAINQWIALPTEVDPINRTVSTELSHFSLFTVMLAPRPAEFELSEFTITPTEVDIEEEVTISVVVTNIGDISGNHDVILKVNDFTAEVKSITLAGGDCCKVNFIVSKDAAGTYIIRISKLSGKFTVNAPLEVEQTPGSEVTQISEPIPPPGPEVTQISEPISEATKPDNITQKSEPVPLPESSITETKQQAGIDVRWWIFGAIITVIFILSIITWRLFRVRKSS